MPAMEPTNSSAAMMIATQRIFMKSMRGSWGMNESGKIFMCWFLPLDGQEIEFLASAVQKYRQGKRHGDRGEHRGEDADHHGHGEALQRTGAEGVQRNAGENAGEVVVEDGAGRLLVAIGDRRLRRHA